MNGSCELLVIGGSAGGFDVLIKALPLLEIERKFPIIIVLHRGIDSHSALAEVLSGKKKILVKEAEDKEEIQPNNIYLAPADYHLLVEKNRSFSLDHSEKMNFSRPSIDATFQTAAEAYGDRCVCLLLSGSNSDGVEGLAQVKELGGLTAVQDPDTCEIPYMPKQALNRVDIDRIVPGDKVAEFIKTL